MIQKYAEQFTQAELSVSTNGPVVAVPVEPENPLRTSKMLWENDYVYK